MSKVSLFSVAFIILILLAIVVYNQLQNGIQESSHKPEPMSILFKKEAIAKSYNYTLIDNQTRPRWLDWNEPEPVAFCGQPEILSIHGISKQSLKSFGKVYLICSDEGRLGNLMSQYGSLYGMARLLDVRAAITEYHKTTLTTMFPNISMPMYSLDHVNCSRYDRHRWLIFHEYVKPSRLKKKNVILGDRQEYSCSEHVQTCLNIWFPGSSYSYRKWSNSVGICWPMTFKSITLSKQWPMKNLQ